MCSPQQHPVGPSLDPRGLTASAGIEVRQQLSYGDWRDYIMTQTNSLKVLGACVSNFSAVVTFILLAPTVIIFILAERALRNESALAAGMGKL